MQQGTGQTISVRESETEQQLGIPKTSAKTIAMHSCANSADVHRRNLALWYIGTIVISGNSYRPDDVSGGFRLLPLLVVCACWRITKYLWFERPTKHLEILLQSIILKGFSSSARGAVLK